MTRIKRIDEMENKMENGKPNPRNFIIVDAWNVTYDELVEDYGGALVSTDYGNFFILPKKEITRLKRIGYCNGYEIPSFCETLDDVKYGLIDGTLDPQEEENPPLVKLF